jgi:hypothetical protein
MRPTILLARAVAAVLLSSFAQQAKAQPLLDIKLDHKRTGEVTLLPEKHEKDFTLGFGEKTATVHLTWSTARDSSDCLRVADVTLTRTSGPPDLKFSHATIRYLPCGAKWNTAETTRFETALLFMSYSTQIGVKSYSATREHVATFTGAGEFHEQGQ